MPAAKVAITIDEELLRIIDMWVKQGRYPNRSQAVQGAIAEQVRRTRRSRLAKELAKLDREEEQKLAEERFAGDAWPES
jgi:Arc/MetJ-type ribon-helix-helix transcriptional regulator